VDPSSVSVEERRQSFRDEALALRGAMAPMASQEERTIEVDDRTIRARLYVPLSEESHALVIYFHGS
jgi:poly(3-hydroxybutyrate) depolymerase